MRRHSYNCLKYMNIYLISFYVVHFFLSLKFLSVFFLSYLLGLAIVIRIQFHAFLFNLFNTIWVYGGTTRCCYWLCYYILDRRHRLHLGGTKEVWGRVQL